MRKYLILTASILIMLCLGGIYGFSIFISPLKTEHGLTTAQTQIIFGFTVATFAVSLVIAGRLLQKIHPRIIGCVGAFLFSSGYLLSSLSEGKIFILVLGIGILSGAGIGFGYACSLTTPVKWFPNFKGLITGLSVAGFGGGAIVLSLLVRSLLEKGIGVLLIFRIISISYGVVVLMSALVMSTPAKLSSKLVKLSDKLANIKCTINKLYKLYKRVSQSEALKTQSLKENSGKGNIDTITSESNSYIPLTKIIREKILWFLFIIMFTGTFSGLLVIGNLKSIGLSYGASEFYATLSISILSIGNSLGRVLWGRITDLVGGNRSIPSALLFLSISLILLSFYAGNNLLLVLITFLVGIGFGANFVLFANEISNVYGIDNLGGLYPFVHLSYGIAGICGPIVAGWLFDFTNSYRIAIVCASSISAFGAVIWVVLRNKIIWENKQECKECKNKK